MGLRSKGGFPLSALWGGWVSHSWIRGLRMGTLGRNLPDTVDAVPGLQQDPGGNCSEQVRKPLFWDSKVKQGASEAQGA